MQIVGFSEGQDALSQPGLLGLVVQESSCAGLFFREVDRPQLALPESRNEEMPWMRIGAPICREPALQLIA